MEIQPILSAMRRNKVGATLICLQIALTLAILCNASFIIQQRSELSRRPTGTDEQQLFVITNQWVGQPEDLSARVQTDLSALRAQAGVANAFATNAYPLTNNGWITGVRLRPEQKSATAMSAVYIGDESALATLGLKLIGGRNFSATEIGERRVNDHPQPPGIIVTRNLAEGLFADGNAVGKTVYIDGGTLLAPIIGVVDKLQVPWTSPTGTGGAFSENSLLLPFRYVAITSYYIVRVRTGDVGAVMRASQQKLVEINPARVLQKVEPLTEARSTAYRDERALSIVLTIVAAVMLGVTAFGIVGLTSYWVDQRRRHIGIRRALGATRGTVLLYFQTENFMISLAGVLIGVALAIGLNQWMVQNFQMATLDHWYILLGAGVLLLLGQLAVMWPSMRAATIPPALVTRDA